MDAINIYTYISNMYSVLNNKSVLSMFPFLILKPTDDKKDLYRFSQFNGSFFSIPFDIGDFKFKELVIITPFRVQCNEIVLEQKNKYVKELLKNSPQTYYDYMLKEYEVFVINLFLKGSPYSFSQKTNLIKKYVLTNYEVIKKANATSLYNKIFKFSALLNNAQILCIIYALLNFIKHTFSNTYLKIRKMIYKGKE